METIAERVQLYKQINQIENNDLAVLFKTKMEADYKQTKERRYLDNFKKLPLVPGFERCEDLPQFKYVDKMKLRAIAKKLEN